MSDASSNRVPPFSACPAAGHPAGEPLPGLGLRLKDFLQVPHAPEPEGSPRAGPPVRVSRYHVVRLIGEGGMGSVYEAEQDRPRRRVALKVIKPGMDSRQVIARFEAEREALARMDHPGIARVYDAGATDEGRPYFAMELVDGVPITDYCDAHAMTVRQRLELFVPVCRAVQHAHQKGVIHRDLKPSNILVSLVDGKPVPKVIDFGIAKATGGTHPAGQAALTEARQLVGTPEYMSPEQAGAAGGDVDTRSDVYSLGAVLYELLTGTTPFADTPLRGLGHDEARRIIREVEPPRPSTRLRQLGRHEAKAPASSAARRHTAGHSAEAPALARGVRGDLDTLVMKCLDKDRSRRYESAAGLAADVERYLNHEPVLACPPTARYRLRKFARRNRTLVASGAGVLAALVLGLTLATVAFLRAAAERDRTAKEATKAEAVNLFLQEMLASVAPERAKGKDPSVRQVLDDAAARIARGELRNHPEIEAAVRTTLGKTYAALGHYAEAEAHLRAALALRRSISQHESLEFAANLTELAEALWGKCDYAGCEAVSRDALALYRRRLTANDPRVANSLGRLGKALSVRGDYEGAERHMREALAIKRSLAGEQLGIATDLVALSAVLRMRGDYDAADASCAEALRIQSSRLGRDSLAVAITLMQMGWLRQVRGDYASAEAYCAEALEIRRSLLRNEHPQVAHALLRLGAVLTAAGDHERAESVLRAALDMQTRLEGPEHPRVAWILEELSQALLAQRRPGDAATLMLDHLSHLRRRVASDDDAALVQLLEVTARVLQQAGLPGDAEPFAREALGVRRRTLPAGHVDLSHSIGVLAPILLDVGEHEEAETLARECLSIRLNVFHPTWWGLADTRSVLGGALLGQNRPHDAEPLLVEGYRSIKDKPDADPFRKAEAARRIAQLHEALGQTGCEATGDDCAMAAGGRPAPRERNGGR